LLTVDSPRLRAAYSGRTAIVTGGASFIGSHLVDALVALEAEVLVIDDFSSGKPANIERLSSNNIVSADLASRDAALSSITEAEYVFHLAAVHGGRGFIDTFPDQLLVNLAIDNNVYTAAAANAVRHVVHASSACVYPVTLQADVYARGLLAEAQAGFESPGQAFPDGAYGWTKIMGEYQLAQFAERGRLKGSSGRIFTAYGERENESHAAIALIAKALLRMDPYPIWGDGRQTRNFTYVADTVHGLLLLGSRADAASFTTLNIGSSHHHTVLEFTDRIFDVLGWRPRQIERETWRPVGVASRASDNSLITAQFDWEPQTELLDGVRATVEWYRELGDRPADGDALESRLLAR
jgi:nucleoside-diphosphate-sugar epimerase